MDDSTQYNFSLVKMPKSEKTNLSAEQMLDQLATSGVPAGASGQTTKIDVKSKGKTTVGGVEMPYVVGITSSKGSQVPSLMGIVPASDGGLVMVIAMAPPTATEIDMEQCNKFFSTISSFR